MKIMRVSYGLNPFFVIVLLASCSFHRGDGGERNPAGSSDHGIPENPYRKGQTVRLEEQRVGCGPASLARIDMGNGFSASDVLGRIASEGTFSGRVRIPTWRALPSMYGYGLQYYVDYAASVEYDRETLRKWFDASAPDNKDSDIYQAASDSEAFKFAVNFVNGNGAVRVYSNQYDVGHRMAALMAVMFAAARNGDVDCVAYIEREWVPKLLPDENVQRLFNSVKADRDLAVADIKEGRLHDTFRGVYEYRQRLYAEIRSLDQAMRQKEQRNKQELAHIEALLRDSYKELRKELDQIAPCRDQVSLHETLYAGISSAHAFPQDLVQRCQDRLNEKLISIRAEQSRLQADLNITQERLKMAQAALERATEKGQDKEVARRQEAIKKYEERIAKLTEQIDQKGQQAEKYVEYLSYLVEPELSSVNMELNRINELLSDRQRRMSSDYMRAENRELNRLKNDLRNNSSNYLSLGFMGGFQSVGIASLSGNRGVLTPAPASSSDPNYPPDFRAPRFNFDGSLNYSR
jgi:hypothetical protein